MKQLIKQIEHLKTTPIRSVIDNRVKEFKAAGNKPLDHIFIELCFCLMTANFNAQRSIDIQNKIGGGFHSLSEKKLAARLKVLGHRFPNTRAKFIAEARKHKKDLSEWLGNDANEREFRRWLKDNVKGLGMKEASHFLRNIGRENCAIIDFHIIDILADRGLITRPKTITSGSYVEIEKVLEKLGKKLGLSLSELDLYLWYLETGKVLK